jgi:uncharacterized LabA/DUF88 family protein
LSTIVFIDGQNLYHLAKNLWGRPGLSSPYTWPSYDVEKVAQGLVSRVQSRVLTETRFYTGVPRPDGTPTDRFWHAFWTNKLRHLRSLGVIVYAGRVNASGQEKGVDVSLAIDLVRLTYEQRYDVAIIVSQDWDFGPAVKLAREISQTQGRSVEFESCFPYEPSNSSNRGIPGTTWVHIDKAFYDSWYDPREYRPPMPQSQTTLKNI